MNHKTDMHEALQLCIDAMLHDGVPTDPYHPRRVALNAAEAAFASRPDAYADARDREILEVIDERDRFERDATELAEKVGQYLGVDVGEWSSANDPIIAAMEALDERVSVQQSAQADERRAWDGDSRESRSAFRNYDSIAEPVRGKTPWQIWRDACAWQARAAAPQAEAAQGVPDGWRELCRRLYVELFHCDQQMRSTRDQDGEPHWTQSAVVRDVLKDAKAALAAPSPDREQVGEACIRPATSHCQNGGDVCLAGNNDGVCCPEDSCDIDDGVRKASVSSDDLDRLLIALGLEPRAYRRSDGHLLVGEILSALAKKHVADASPSRERGEQECPHGVDDGACKQCYGEATRGEQGALPQLKEGEEFVCGDGCGTTTPESYDFEYSREEFPDGRVESKTEKGWRASCCKADLMVYSNLEDTFTPIEDYIASAPTLEPVHGDVLPAIGEQVLIHLASADVWEPHTVVGYYVWPDLRGDSFLQRVFVRVRHGNGTMNARMLRDIRRPDGSHYVKPTVKLPAPQPQATEPKGMTSGQQETIRYAAAILDQEAYHKTANDLRALLAKGE